MTPINLAISATEQPVTWFDFDVDYKQLGERVNALTVTAPENARFRGDQQSVTVGPVNGKFSVGYYAKFYPDAFKGARVDLSYDSTHAIVTGAATLPASPVVDDRNECKVTAPYLFFEDFSGVESFSSYDEYSTSNPGSRNAVSFLSGWTGARIGAQSGTSIRIACRRETSADYDARVDSAPITALKSEAKVQVMFDYGADNEFSSGVFSNGDVGQTCYVGYVTDSKGYASGNKDGTFANGNSFYVKEYTGTYDNLPNKNKSYNIASLPRNARITWRTVVEHKAGAHNTTAWLYLDNIRVSIAQ